MLALPFLLAALPAACPPVQDDTDLLTLTNGKEIECRVLFEGEDTITYSTRRKTREIPRAEVAEIQSIERSLREFLDRFAALDPTHVGSLTDLATFAEGAFLPAEARHTWIRIITLDSENERAWTKLGGVKGRKGWRLKVRGRFYDLERLRQRVSDWKNAMEIPTAHFLIKTDLEPERALDIAIDIERIYLAYYDALGPELKLYPFDEVPEIHLFGDRKNYPKPPTPGWGAWFGRISNEVYVDASGTFDVLEVRRNVAYCLLFNSFRRALGARVGELPPWAREGLARGLARAIRGDAGRMRLELGIPHEASFSHHARDADALPLKRLLTADFAAFQAGTHVERFRAQAYTLTFFLVNAEDGRYRAGLADYLRSAFLGKGAATHLEKALGVKIEDLEQEWFAYVQGLAGR
ncbi:MAG: hypothetical protein V3T22_12115 [Planctomycetota bacterium]